MYPEVKVEALFDLTQTAAAELLNRFEYPWEALPHIKEFILQLGATLPADKFDQPAQDVWISKEAVVAPTAYIGGPCIIMPGSEVRHCAYIRTSALVGEHCVVGNSTELKNVILFNNVQVPHYNYVGDSILGYCSHMGAGSITSNIKSDKSDVKIYGLDEPIETNLIKVGALVGDYVEVGCNSVLNPGAV
ncbi:MAG TPA: UDP-N-acetylglucosamine pyrophosphorylase, partial [Clostridiaceae bacterium]|nr:UDP-N-acetylglucosamine pyrophosphorylase [Clostridiaceae bacterium]